MIIICTMKKERYKTKRKRNVYSDSFMQEVQDKLETGMFLIKAVVDFDFGPSSIQIELESENGKSVVMKCRKTDFREEYVGRKVSVEYENPFIFGIFYQILSIRPLEEK